MPLYRLLRFLTRQILGIFFSAIRVVGEPLVEDKPVLVVANHPNFMFDPLLLGVSFERALWYLGKATLFHNPAAAWILGSLGVVPVYRRKEGGSPAQNRKTFSRVCSKLKAGEGVALFPEGVSMGERRIFPVKTGAARIAFQALKEGTDEELVIQPVGIVYTDMDQFQSSVTVVGGEPIRVKDCLPEVEDDSDPSYREAVKALTARIEAELQRLSVHVVDPHEAELVEKVGKVYGTAGMLGDDWQRLSVIAHEIDVRDHLPPEQITHIEQDIDEYLGLLSRWGLGGGKSLEERVWWPLWLFLLVPVSFGALFHAIPYHLTGPLVRKLSTHKVYVSTLKVSMGAALFLLWYCLAMVSLWATFSLSTFHLWWIFLSLVTCGVLTNSWLVSMLREVYRVLPFGVGPFPEAFEQREQLLATFEELRGAV